MAKLRLGPSGPFVNGVTNGDVLIWNAATLEWEPGASPSSVTEFDYILETRADLVAAVPPVAGVISLPTGSYFFKGDVVLNDGEVVRIDGTDVTMMGGGVGDSRGLVTRYADNQPGIELVGGTLTAYNMFFGSAAATRYGISVDATSVMKLVDCSVQAPTGGTQAGINVAAGTADVQLFRSTISGGAECVHADGGIKLVLVDCSLSTASYGVHVTGGNATLVQIGRCKVAAQHEAAVALYNQAALSTWIVEDCDLSGVSGIGEYIVYTDTIDSLTIRGGRVYGVGGAVRKGIGVAAGFGTARLESIRGSSLSTFIDGTASVGLQAVIRNCDADGTVSVGVDWPAANLPANGLLEQGCWFNVTTPFANHSEVSTNVTRRSCYQSGAPLTETALAP